ncbi:MAG: protein kinase [Chloroflexota bacterium]
MPLSTGQVLNNRYRIVSLLGQGGMGAVYRAWDLTLKRPLALKENLETTPEAQKQFEREAQILANLSHPNLPRVSDYFSIPGQGQYLVMDFVEGVDLQTMIDQQGALSENQALEWVCQICEALDYLHNQSSPIIHRDIKPANIKIRPDGRAMLVDFGIAKLYDPHRSTTVGAKAVTPGFSPPEQYSGKTDARSDIYALGATLYTLLTGETLPESALRAVGSGNFSPPRQLKASISPHVEAAVLRAIEISTDKRFQRAGELRTALTQPAQAATPPTAKMQPPIPATQVMPPPEIPVQPAGRAMPVPKKRPYWLALPLGGLVCLVVAGVICIASGGLGSGVPEVQPATQVAIGRPTATRSQPTTAPQPTPTPARGVEPTQPPAPNYPTATPTPWSPPPTEPPPPVPSGPAILRVEQSSNCRGGPGTDYVLLRTFTAGTELEIIGRGDNGWWLIRINDPSTRKKQCWISGGTPQGNLDAVPYSDWIGDENTAMTPWP